MISPTRRLVLSAAAGAPLAMLAGIVQPDLWLAPLLWIVILLALAAFDVSIARHSAGARLVTRRAVSVGEEFPVEVVWAGPLPASPQAALTAGPLFAAESGSRATIWRERSATIALKAQRRGLARLSRLDLRWQGPLGLVWRHRTVDPSVSIAITPDVRPVSSDGVALLTRDARSGLMAQLETGQGGEFDALAEYQTGMDRRRVDWKQSARHSKLLAKEFRAERDNNIVLAFDCGRTMIEPLAGLARLDRAITAGLLTAWVSLKMGDRVSLFGFDARPRLASAPMTGARSIAPLQRLAATLDYSSEETNFTLGLSALAARLDRRSLIILFTDFVDSTSAELMLRAIGRLLARHVLLCVVLRDDELETLAAAEPVELDDVSRAVIASGLLRDRRIVLARLRRMGVDVLEAPWADLGPQLARRYLEAKRRRHL